MHWILFTIPAVPTLTPLSLTCAFITMLIGFAPNSASAAQKFDNPLSYSETTKKALADNLVASCKSRYDELSMKLNDNSASRVATFNKTQALLKQGSLAEHDDSLPWRNYERCLVNARLKQLENRVLPVSGQAMQIIAEASENQKIDDPLSYSDTTRKVFAADLVASCKSEYEPAKKVWQADWTIDATPMKYTSYNKTVLIENRAYYAARLSDGYAKYHVCLADARLRQLASGVLPVQAATRPSASSSSSAALPANDAPTSGEPKLLADTKALATTTRPPPESWQSALVKEQIERTALALRNIRFAIRTPPGLSHPVFFPDDKADWIIDPSSGCAISFGSSGNFISAAWSGACDDRGVAVGAGVVRSVRYQEDGDIEMISWVFRSAEGLWDQYFLIGPSATYDPARPYCISLQRKISRSQPAVLKVANSIPLEVELFFQSVRPTTRLNCESEQYKAVWARYTNRVLTGEFTASGRPQISSQQEQKPESKQASSSQWFTDEEKKDMRELFFGIITELGKLAEQKGAKKQVDNAAKAYEQHRSKPNPNTMAHYNEGARLLGQKEKAISDQNKAATVRKLSPEYDKRNREYSAATKSPGTRAPDGRHCLAKYDEVHMSREMRELLERGREMEVRYINLCRDVRIDVFECSYQSSSETRRSGDCGGDSSKTTVRFEQTYDYHVDPKPDSGGTLYAVAFCPAGSRPTEFLGLTGSKRISGFANYQCIWN